jgi:ubiquitin thioesterase protein OTUB1
MYLAIAFSYFETLLKLGDKKLVEAECARMLSLSDFITAMTDYETWIFEDMRDEWMKILQEIANRTHLAPSVDDILLPPFNDQSTSDGLVYWCRLLASAYLKSRAAEFQDFIPVEIGSVENYCKNVLEPSNNEIEHVGMTLLVEILLKPIDVAVEIVYLDRSEGAQVNTHYFPIQTPNTERSIIHVLYRPGHYDILYKEMIPARSRSISQQQIIESAAAHSDLQVNSVTRLAHRHSIQSTPGEYAIDMNILMNFPPPFPPPPSSRGFSEPFSPVQEFSHVPTHAASYSIDSSRTTHSISPASSVSPGPSFLPPTSLPIHPHTMTADASPTATRMTASTSQFRPSMYQYKEDWGDTPAQGFQTSTFKNSHYNVSHYNNPNFQPEQWTPDCDEAVGKLTRHRTS